MTIPNSYPPDEITIYAVVVGRSGFSPTRQPRYANGDEEEIGLVYTMPGIAPAIALAGAVRMCICVHLWRSRLKLTFTGYEAKRVRNQ